VVIPRSGRWLMEENPSATIAAIVGFLDGSLSARV
jgi:hypothetical protein